MNPSNPSMQHPEFISALVDGQLAEEDFAAALQACGQDASVLARWNTYHLIGDVLRSPHQALAPMAETDLAFVGRLAGRLADEAPHLKQAEPLATFPKAGASAESAGHRGAAANDGVFRWKLVAGLASLAAVSAIVWSTAGTLTSAFAPQFAQAPAVQQIVVASPQGPMVRSVRLEELLAAHRQLGGTSALQEPSGFLRNAAFETPQNAGR
ncbi:MAG: sigma-E factor negative regulatory protein [Polaromonas sp.]